MPPKNSCVTSAAEFGRTSGGARASVANVLRRWVNVALLSGSVLTMSPGLLHAHDLMPAPAEMRLGAGRLAVTSQLTVAIRGQDDAPLLRAIARGLEAIEARTGVMFAHDANGAFTVRAGADAASASLVIDCAATGAALPTLGEDESYTLEISDRQAVLRAPLVVGALRGIETLVQLVQSDREGWFWPAVAVHDQPRFPWRGLMIDVVRHWQPLPVIERNLDGMALVKLNVLHLHLTDDQGFRVESKKIPRLTQLASDGHYFTQDQIREIITYAADRGIRVVPEFDTPGHGTSWAVAFPELASAPGPYVIERKWGVFDPVLDPTNEKLYALLDTFLGEMAALFPDPYIHIGGDENNGVQWNANPRIQAFIGEHHLKNNEGLHAYYNRRVRDILHKYGKKLIGWDEILNPDLPKDSIIQSWRGPDGLAAAASQGYQAILSNGYYIDLNFPAADHYRNDPIPADTKLTPEEQKRILGGEATMWAEWVTPETIDSRIWPRTAAIAERLWSPRDVNDVADMYRRLAVVSRRLEEAGLRHDMNRPAMIRRFAGDHADAAMIDALTELVSLVEPVKRYARGGQQPDFTQLTPLTGLADCARPESDLARGFVDDVATLLYSASPEDTAADSLRDRLVAWQNSAKLILAHGAATSPRIGSDAVPVATALADACDVGVAALDALKAGQRADAAWRTAALARLDRAAEPHVAVLLPMLSAVRQLAAAASLAGQRGTLTPADWRAQIERLSSPPAAPTP